MKKGDAARSDSGRVPVRRVKETLHPWARCGGNDRRSDAEPVVPKAIRSSLGLREGARLRLEVSAGKFEAVPEPDDVRILMNDGFPVITQGPKRKKGETIRSTWATSGLFTGPVIPRSRACETLGPVRIAFPRGQKNANSTTNRFNRRAQQQAKGGRAPPPCLTNTRRPGATLFLFSAVPPCQ
jgi:bifunctional DNA-binding transcriptional regulator/antitoxin component of YhaV-PrlF toxin-antitoxin module